MIRVYQQAQQQDAVLPQPVRPVEGTSDGERNQEMQCDMKNRKSPFPESLPC